MKIMYLVHGYPPRENAGTEQHCSLLAAGMKQLGHNVLVISATRAIGKKHGELIREKNIIRIVNNIPSRPLEQAEQENTLQAIIEREIKLFQPDIIHVEHIQFLSSGLRFSVPSLLTLHDAWLWCPAGGTLLRNVENGLQICNTPSANDCLQCYAQWRPFPTKTASLLMKLAGHLQPVVASDTLHSLWKKVPAFIRSPIAKEQKNQLETTMMLQKRNQAMLDFAQQSSVILSPSQFLAQQAPQELSNKIRILPHGIAETREHIGGKGFVFLGTMEKHKGPDLVAAAYLEAFPDQDIPIHFYGNGSLSVPLSHSPAVSRKKVLDILTHADCLVMGSIWPENSPMLIIEAKAMGCPIIAPNIGGIPEIIQDGIDGLLYSVGNQKELSTMMKKSLCYPFQVTKPPSISTFLELHEELYRELLE